MRSNYPSVGTARHPPPGLLIQLFSYEDARGKEGISGIMASSLNLWTQDREFSQLPSSLRAVMGNSNSCWTVVHLLLNCHQIVCCEKNQKNGTGVNLISGH